jgi:hypothetical protein
MNEQQQRHIENEQRRVAIKGAHDLLGGLIYVYRKELTKRGRRILASAYVHIRQGDLN